MSVTSIASRRRLQNLTGSENCPTCFDDGLCVVATEPQLTGSGALVNVELMGPCPRCERGFRAEFGIRGDESSDVRGGPWGPDGFWRGRPVPPELLE